LQIDNTKDILYFIQKSFNKRKPYFQRILSKERVNER
jgi:hypothetical protein